MIDSMIFDLDGTLWDSTKQLTEHWHKSLCQLRNGFGMDLHTLRHLMGKTSDEIADCLQISTTEVVRIQSEENNYLRANPGKLYPGVTETIDALYTRGLRLFIASNCQSGYIETFLMSSGLERYFTDTICFGDTNKPKYKNVKSLIKGYDLTPVLVGDTQDDFEAAKYNNLKFIWASYGFGKIKSPSLRINDISELLGGQYYANSK